MRRTSLLLLIAFFVFIFNESRAQEYIVSGIISAQEDGCQLPGVTVSLKGATYSTVSDMEGKYSLSIPKTGGVLIFSYLGFVSKEIEVRPDSSVDIQLRTNNTLFDDVLSFCYWY